MNAIILAAGMGTRLRPLTNEIPKCLVKVCGEPMVERQIRFLREAGIDDITLVSGYKAEALDYLKDKFGVDIIFNAKYDTCNNIWSLVKVLSRFGDTYVIEGDVYMEAGCFDKTLSEPTYFAVNKRYEREWGLETDKDLNLLRVNIGSGEGYIMSGISYWPREAADIISEEIRRLISADEYTDLFWDNAVLNVLPQITSRMNVKVSPAPILHEIDTEPELRALEKFLRSSV